MKRSKFSLSHYRLFTCDMGELVPCGLVEVLPGDTFEHSTSALVRCSPMMAPAMHPVEVRIHHFFVPHRLIWNQFEDFITGGPDGLNANTVPTRTLDGSESNVGTLPDYLGVPRGLTNNVVVSALPFRAYQTIWNEYYRDPDLEPEVTVSLGGPSDSTDLSLKNCSWEKDYFTSARPWELKGAAITLPLGTTAPVKGIGFVGTPTTAASQSVRESTPLPNRTYSFAANTMGANGVLVESDGASSGTIKPLVYADLSNASAVSINVLRQALALQRYKEARARYGSRYTEYLRYLGVKSSDARLQRPEYLGGGKQIIQFSEVLQTSAKTVPALNDSLGQMAGHGIGAMRSNRYRRYFEEHGYVMSLMSTRPRTMYKDGLARTWNRRTKEDFFQKELQFIGQQAVLNKEIYSDVAQGTGAGQADAVWGYQDRYDDYRRMESGIAGEFKTTLNFWQFARSFGSLPTLNASFVKAVPTKVPFAVQSNDVLWVMARHQLRARRLVAKVGISKTF